MKFVFKIAALAIIATVILSACAKRADVKPTAVPKDTAVLDTSLTENALPITISLTTGDKIKAELYPDIAPITVENFTKLIEENFFDGLIFHRVIEGFMIQGGGYDVDGNQKVTDAIKGEFSANSVENNLKHTRGVLSMARTSVMDSASSQFFIMHEDAPYLDGQYAAFGKVIDGMDVVDKIVAAETDASDKPIEDIIIETITLD